MQWKGLVFLVVCLGAKMRIDKIKWLDKGVAKKEKACATAWHVFCFLKKCSSKVG